MIIEKVNNKEDAKKCDELLTKLIMSEREFDDNIRQDYIVKEYFENLYEKKNNILLIVKDDNKAIGYAYCKIIEVDDGPQIHDIALLDGIYVNEEYRNKKIATNLIEKCKEWVKETGAKALDLNVLEKNEKAISLYKNIGFCEFEKKMRLIV